MVRVFGFLFIFIFSPFNFINGNLGKTEIDKFKWSEDIVAPQTVKLEKSSDSLTIAIKTLSEWQIASGSYYDPKDSSQTMEGSNGKGSFGRMIQSGSIALGSSFTKFFRKGKDSIKVYIEIENLNVMTPFGKGIFRLDDSMADNFSKGGEFFIDFHEEDLTSSMRQKGRFDVAFRIHKIEEFN